MHHEREHELKFEGSIPEAYQRYLVPLIVNDAVADMFPNNPSTFMQRVPHGYHDHDAIRADVVEATINAHVVTGG